MMSRRKSFFIHRPFDKLSFRGLGKKQVDNSLAQIVAKARAFNGLYICVLLLLNIIDLIQFGNLKS